MTLDPDKLMAFKIPSVQQHFSPEDAAFYALSVGFGQEPLDARQLAYVDPALGPKVVPSMVLVMAHPGFWLGNPRSGVDASDVLHADQAFEILAPLPVSARVTSRTRIIALIDKGPGKPALLRTETVIDAVGDKPLARLVRTTFVRGGGGFGGENETPVPPRAPPDRPPDHIVDLATRPEQALYYRLNGDLNPLHSDLALAREAGFERPILHGLATAGVVCHAIIRALANYDGERLQAMRLRFAGPVMPGETIRTEIWEDGSFRARVVDRDTIVIAGGEARVTPAQLA